MKVTIEVDLSNKTEVNAAIEFLQKNGGAAKSKATAKTPAPEPEEEAEEENEDDLNGEDEITLEELRELTSAKAKDDATRKKIREKLEKLGAPNVTKLDKSKYADYKKFITSLK